MRTGDKRAVGQGGCLGLGRLGKATGFVRGIVLLGALAQDSGGAAAPASPGAPSIQIQPVQTPTITNAPAALPQLPSQPSSAPADQVTVFGTVFNEAAFIFRPEKTVNDYLAQAGGPRKEADRKSMYVIRADGSVVSARQNGWLSSSLNGHRVMPGDAIVVPEDFARTTWTKDLKDWTQILYQFGLGAAAIKVFQD